MQNWPEIHSRLMDSLTEMLLSSLTDFYIVAELDML